MRDVLTDESLIKLRERFDEDKPLEEEDQFDEPDRFKKVFNRKKFDKRHENPDIIKRGD